MCTCSLRCVREHKDLYECDGERNKTRYISLNKFNDSNLLSDYRFLEESQRDVETVARDQNNRKYQFNPRYLQILKSNATRKEVKLVMMPVYMGRHQKNHSYYNLKEGVIDWTIEWILHQSTHKHYFNHLDSMTILECLKAFLNQQTTQTKNSGLKTTSLQSTDHKTEHQKTDQKIIMHENTKKIISEKENIEKINTEKQNMEMKVKENKNTDLYLTDQQKSDHKISDQNSRSNVMDMAVDELCVFMKVETMCKSEEDDRKYIRLGMESKVEDILKRKTILEFPTFLIAPLSLSDVYETSFFNQKS